MIREADKLQVPFFGGTLAGVEIRSSHGGEDVSVAPRRSGLLSHSSEADYRFQANFYQSTNYDPTKLVSSELSLNSRPPLRCSHNISFDKHEGRLSFRIRASGMKYSEV
jgi:hypothetical protein